MLVMCRCPHGSSNCAGDEKLKYYDIPSFPNNNLPFIPTDELHAPQLDPVVDKERKVNMRVPPPIPQYIGRACQFMKIKRRGWRITMSLVHMDRQPELMQIERQDGQIKIQLMTYVSDAMNNDAKASTSASTSQQVVETCDQEDNGKEVEVATDKCDSDEEMKKLAKAA